MLPAPVPSLPLSSVSPSPVLVPLVQLLRQDAQVVEVDVKQLLQTGALHLDHHLQRGEGVHSYKGVGLQGHKHWEQDTSRAGGGGWRGGQNGTAAHCKTRVTQVTRMKGAGMKGAVAVHVENGVLKARA